MIKREQLISKINAVIEEFGHDSDIKRGIENYFKDRNLNTREAVWVWTKIKPLATLGDAEEDNRFLFLFVSALLQFSQKYNFSFKLEDYFSTGEIERFKNYREDKEEENPFPLIIHGVQKINDKMFQTVQPIQTVIGEWLRKNILIYNFNTQRNPKITAYGEQINMDKNKIKEIAERTINGEQFPDPIILNILNNGDSSFQFIPKYGDFGDLLINEGSVINTVDGFHRLSGYDLALNEMPYLEFSCQITFTFLTEKAAHDYMAQKDKQKPMKKDWIKTKDYSLKENLVVDSIIDDKLSELGRVMKDDDQYIKRNMALTKKSIVATAVKDNYKDMLDSNSNVRAIARWIVEFTDYLMGLYTDEFINNPYEVKQNSYINHKNMFYGYIALSRYLYNNKKWKELLKLKMASIDFSVDNPVWKDIGIHLAGDLKPKYKEKLYKLFEIGGEE